MKRLVCLEIDQLQPSRAAHAGKRQQQNFLDPP